MVDRTDFQTLDALSCATVRLPLDNVILASLRGARCGAAEHLIVVSNRSDDDDSTEKSYGGT